MVGAESFSTIAEVAIAFLGFTGMVGIFAGQDHPPAVLMRFWAMVAFGLALLLLALLPLVLHHLGCAAPRLWVACSLALLLFLVGHIALFVPRVMRLRRVGAWGGVPFIVDNAPPLMLSACLVTQVLNLLGVGLGRSHGGYLLGLFFLLAVSGFNFITLLVALRSSEPRQAV